MRAKLIKKDEHYFLEVQPYTLSTSQKYTIIANTFDKPKGDILQLSLKNCQAIERGYDLDELAFQSSTLDDVEHSDMYRHLAKKFFKEGFQKALEILGDRRFTEEDVRKVCSLIFLTLGDGGDITTDEIIQSIQQNEWDCIVEMECCGNYNPPCNINCGYGPKPKLDSDGCLILKRVI